MNLKKMPGGGTIWVDPTYIVAAHASSAWSGNKSVPAIELRFRSGETVTYFLRESTMAEWIAALTCVPMERL